MAGQGISVPISLQISNLQAIINEIQSKMSNLKVGSGGFRALETSLKYLQKELDSLQVQAQKPFMTENQFSSAQKSVTRLEDEFNNLQLKVNRIKFSDLNLNPDQQAQLKALQDEVVAIQNSLKSLKETAKQEFLGSDLGKVWQEIDPTASTKSLDQITSNIRRAVLDQKELADQAKEAWQDYAKATSLSDTVEKALKTKNPLENLMSAKEYNSFFSENKNGILSFKSGQKPVFEQWLIDNLQVDPNIAHNLVQQSANQIREELKNAQSAIRAELNTKIKPTARTDESTAKTDYDKQSASLLQLQDILNRVAAAYLNIDTNSADLKQRLAENGISADKLRESFVQAAQAELSLGNNAKTVNTTLATLKTTLDSTNASFLRQQRVTQSFNSMKMAVVNFMGFNQVLNITRRAVREAINHIKELDTVMNGIAIVTDMSTGDLWTQIDQYSKMAQAYGVSITGAYEVSQIYYQQGLETADVMNLTNETLKLAKISGLDYATTTDYMTTAIRGFKMEMSEASTVVDVYSNLAAHTAVSQEELAVAMSKTASSMEGVGATFEEASAMIGTMVAVTRESATNIGSAMKSIASRYGELTKDPTKLVDEEGEAMAFNKVDAALQSVGISMKTVDGQFREFTDVIVELGEKWDQLDSTQQRYIATQFAGNRQQSRFLALVSNVDLLKSNLDVAMNSEDTGTLQALKALDSIESKIEQVKVAYQQFYTTIGVESVWKGLLDSTKEVINTLNGLPKLFGKIPVGAIAVVYDIINLIKGALTHGLTAVADVVINHLQNTTNEVENAGNKMRPAGENFFDKFIAGMTSKYGALKEAARKGVDEANQAVREQRQYQILDQKYKNEGQINSNIVEIGRLRGLLRETTPENGADQSLLESQRLDNLAALGGRDAVLIKIKELEQANEQLRAKNKELEDSFNAESNAENNNADAKNRNALATKNGISAALKLAASQHQISASTSAIASGLNMVATMIGTSSRAAQVASGAFMMFGGALRGFGAIFEYIKNLGTSAQTAFPWMAAIMAGISLINGISQMWETDEERIERLTKEAEDLNNAAKEAKANYKTLDNSIKKLDELRKKRYESAEAAEEYQTQVDELADKFPQMIAGFDAAGNVIIDTTNAEEILTEARKKSAQATYDAAKKELDVAKENREKARKSYESATGGLASALDNLDYSNTSGHYFETFNKSRYVGRDEHYHNIAADNWNLATQGSGENGKFTDTELLQNLKDLSGWSKQQGIDDFEFLWNFDYRDGTISDLQRQMANFAENANGKVSLEFRQVENLLRLQQQNAVDEAYTNVVKAANALSEADVEGKDYTNKVQDVNKAIEAYKTAVGGYAPEEVVNAFSELEASVNEMNSAEQEFISMTRIYEGNKKAVVGAWQQSAKGNQEAWDILQKSSFASMLATETIVAQIDDKKFNGDYEAWEKDAAAQQAAKDTQENYAETLSSILKDKEQLKQFEQMGFDTNNYTGQDIIDAFQIKDQDLIDAINKHYSEGIENRQKRLQSQLAAALKIKPDTEGNYDLTAVATRLQESNDQFYQEYWKLLTDDEKNNFTGNEEKVLNSILEEYQKLSNEGYSQQAKVYGNKAMTMFEDIAQKAPYDIQKTLWNLILENGIDTKTGLTKIMQTVSSNSELSKYLDTNTLQQLIDNIITNVGLEIDMMLDDLLNNWEDESKTLSKALSGGLSSKEAAQFIEQAQNLGVQLGEGKEFNIDTAFNWDGKTLTLTAEAWNAYWKKLQEANDANVTAFQGDIDAAQEILDLSVLDKETLQTQYKDSLTEMGFTEADWKEEKYWNKDQLTEAGQTYIQGLIDKRQQSLNEYKRYAQLEEDALTREHDRMNGIYKDVKGQAITDIEELKKLAQNNTATGINKANKEALNEAYDTLISDVLSKGLDNIHLEDYEGLVAADKINLESYLNTNSYEAFINNYAKLAGKSIDETNELLAQAIEKQQEKTSSEVLSNLQFINKNQFAASLSDLTELANRFDIGLGDLTTHWNQALGAYIVDITQIDAFKNFTGVENYQAIINDSINEFFSNLVNLIKSALSGSLSNTDRGKLDQWVADYNKQFGDNLKLDFTDTAEGLKMSEDSAIGLYSALKQVDTLQASLVFDELNKSLQESNEHYKTMSGIMEHIAALDSKIKAGARDNTMQRPDVEERLGNVNLDAHARHTIPGALMRKAGWEEYPLEDYATTYTATEISENKGPAIGINITPITNDGKEILSPDDLTAYIDWLFDNASNAEAVMKLDSDIEKGGKNLVMEAKTASEATEEAKEALITELENNADMVHENQQAMAEYYKNLDKPSQARIEQYERELALAKEIYTVRSTTEDAGFSFMSNKIPGAQNNPLNYFGDWAKAIHNFNDALKSESTFNYDGKTFKAGGIDYADWYNMITEMNNLASKGREIEFAGETLDGSLEAASRLIQKGADSLAVTDTGEIKVALKGMSLDFSQGADAFSGNVSDGIKSMAESQVSMLDSMIQLLETIVAMEKLGDIDVDGNGLDVSEIFKVKYDDRGFELNEKYWDQYTQDFTTVAEKILKDAEDNEELAKALKEVQINNFSVHDMFQDAIDGTKDLEIDAQAYTAIMNSFYKAAISGDYSLDNIIGSLKDILAGTGYEGEIKIGDQTLVFAKGETVVKTKEGKYTGEHAKGTYDTAQEAAEAEAFVNNGFKENELQLDEETGKLYKQTIMGAVEYKVELDENNKPIYKTRDGQTFASEFEAVKYAYNDEKARREAGGIAGQSIPTFEEFSIDVVGHVVTGDVTIENENDFQARTHEQVQELAAALASNDGQLIADTAIKMGIKVDVDPNGNISEETRKKLTEVAGIEDKTITVQMAAGDSQEQADALLKVLKEIDPLDPSINVDLKADGIESALSGIATQLKSISELKTQTITINEEHNITENSNANTTQNSNATVTRPGQKKTKLGGAIGTIGLANAKGTLMGELGPELVVSNGRYFVAGQDGPEMIELADDAIVFNHLQTKSLLEKGTSPGRGKAITNERNAVAFATGNVNGGPAMASASAALAALKQLRAQWKALAGLSAQDLAGKGGSGGGGGGGGKDAAKDPAFVKDLEKWYNWLQRIAVLEEKINYEEAKRNKIASDMIAHGQDYAKSLLESFNYLKEQTAVHQSLADSQQIYFNQRREQMNSASNPFSALYTFDEYGQLKYKNGALAQLSEIISRDQLTGKGTYTASEQYAILKNNGFERYMQYDSSGNEIDRSQEGWETNAIQAFWDKIDADKEEMQSLHDSIEEHKKAVLEDQEKANEILKEIEDNQISVEDKVLKAIEDTRQREIDELQKQRDAIEESANNLINGLSEQLNREKDMYSQQASQDELTRLQRQLGILQNSGGSASQIASLQKEIGQKQQDAYFEAQQRQIDTLQQASQNELERLDRQIDLMTESLEYEKENGLLWGAVYEVMAGTPEQITSFITEHDSQYWGVSPTQLTQDTRDILFEAQQFVTYRQEMKDGITGMIDAFNSYKVETEKQLEDTRKLAMDASGANSESTKKDTGGGSGGSPGGASKPAGGKKVASTSYIDAGNSGHKIHVVYNDGTSSDKLEAHNWDKKIITGGTKTCYCSKCNHYMGIVYPGDAHFSQGGMVDYTGPAMVHGSKSRPESVLNAEQTKILRDNILSNKPNSLINLLQTYNNGYDANTLIPATKEGVIIEQATVEMHVAQIANDYDASRAGEQALEKIMAIARKSQGSTRIGR